MSSQSFETWVQGSCSARLLKIMVLIYRNGGQVKGEGMGRMCSMHEIKNVCSILVGNLKDRGHLRNPDVGSHWLTRHYAMKTFGDSDCIYSRFLDLSSSLKRVVSFTPLPLHPSPLLGFTHWIGGWVSPRTGLDDMEKRKFCTLPRLELWSLGRPSRSQLQYRLSYSLS
jgi:hypothetical protein